MLFFAYLRLPLSDVFIFGLTVYPVTIGVFYLFMVGVTSCSGSWPSAH